MLTALELFASRLPKKAVVLDIGAGASDEIACLNKRALLLDVCDYAITGVRFEAWPERPQQYDGIFCSHTLEHVRNVGIFLDKIYRSLKIGGILGLVVPPAKQEIVGGHLTIWNAGLLLYNLIRAGFDCSEASVASYDYNVAVVMRKKHAMYSATLLREDIGDIETLREFFPIPASQGFNGQISSVRWE